MPCDQHTFIDSYIEVLSEISQYCLSHNVHYFIIAGDLNTDISRHNSANTIALKHFISDECLQLALSSNASLITHTFISALGTHSLIDHFILTESLMDCILSYKQVDSIDNLSDHLPIVLHLNCNVEFATATTPTFIPKALWCHSDDIHIKVYREHLDLYLSDIIINEDLLCCITL